MSYFSKFNNHTVLTCYFLTAIDCKFIGTSFRHPHPLNLESECCFFINWEFVFLFYKTVSLCQFSKSVLIIIKSLVYFNLILFCPHKCVSILPQSWNRQCQFLFDHQMERRDKKEIYIFYSVRNMLTPELLYKP